MARTTKAELQAHANLLIEDIAALKQQIEELRTENIELREKLGDAYTEVRELRALVPAPTTATKLAAVPPSNKAAAQAAAREAAMATGRCTRLVPMSDGTWGFEFYGRKAA